MARLDGRSRGAQVIAIGVVVMLAIGVGALALLALRQANPDPEQTAAPAPTFSLGVQGPTATPIPTPIPTPERVVAPRAEERFLSSLSGTLWRGIAGVCGGVAPVLERSNDGGASWTGVAPLDRGVAQIASLDALPDDAAEVVAALDPGCATQALRSYTGGDFWEPYPEVLAGSRYVDVADAAVVHLSTGPLEAPCASASGLRAGGDVVALICDRVPYVRTGAKWMALPAPDAAAVAISGSDVLVGHISDGCGGLTLTRFFGASADAAERAGCADVPDPAASTAIAAWSDGTLVWSGDALVTVP